MKLFLLLLCLAAPVSAQETQPLAWDTHRAFADNLSTALDAAQIGLDTIHNWREPERKAALLCEGFRLGVAVGIAEGTKLVVHRTRPDGSDRKSFFSEHSAVAASTSGWRFAIGIPLTGTVGYLRMAAAKHYASDVSVGLAVGFLSRLVCRSGA